MSTCSYCWTRGHNKRGCPKLKKQAAEEKAQGQTTWRTRYVDSQKKASKQRRCSYCREVGHTRRTCSELKDHKNRFQATNSAFRKKYLEALKGMGLGVGTLIKREHSFYRDGERTSEPMVFMVSNVNWTAVDFTEGIDQYKSCEWFTVTSLPAAPETDRRYGNIVNGHFVQNLMSPPLESIYEQPYYWDRGGWEIVSPVSASCVQASVPCGWSSGGRSREMEDKEFQEYQFSNWVTRVQTVRAEGYDYLPQL